MSSSSKEQAIKKIIDEISLSIAEALAKAYDLGYQEGLDHNYFESVLKKHVKKQEQQESDFSLDAPKILKEFAASDKKVMVLPYNQKFRDRLNLLLRYYHNKGRYDDVSFAKRKDKLVLFKIDGGDAI